MALKMSWWPLKISENGTENISATENKSQKMPLKISWWLCFAPWMTFLTL